MAPLTHLQRLEAESIHIFRKVVAGAEKPVMLHSVGEESSVMLHLARKALFPAPAPFPLFNRAEFEGERLPLKPGEKPIMNKVRFRTRDCYPLAGASESEAATLVAIIPKRLFARTQCGRGASSTSTPWTRRKINKLEGYF